MGRRQAVPVPLHLRHLRVEDVSADRLDIQTGALHAARCQTLRREVQALHRDGIELLEIGGRVEAGIGGGLRSCARVQRVALLKAETVLPCFDTPLDSSRVRGTRSGRLSMTWKQ